MKNSGKRNENQSIVGQNRNMNTNDSPKSNIGKMDSSSKTFLYSAVVASPSALPRSAGDVEPISRKVWSLRLVKKDPPREPEKKDPPREPEKEHDLRVSREPEKEHDLRVSREPEKEHDLRVSLTVYGEEILWSDFNSTKPISGSVEMRETSSV